MKGVYISFFNEVDIQDFKSNKHNTMDALTHDSSNNRIITYWQDAECAAEKKAGKEKRQEVNTNGLNLRVFHRFDDLCFSEPCANSNSEDSSCSLVCGGTTFDRRSYFPTTDVTFGIHGW